MGNFPCLQALVFGILLGTTCLPAPARARVATTTTYTKVQTFNAALRFLRVEKDFEIVEKDPDSGYLLFRYPIPQREEKTGGSVEVIERDDSVVFVVQLPQMPEYHERHLVDGLLEKLSADYGDPPQREPTREKDESNEEKDEPSDEHSGKSPPQNHDAPVQRHRIK